MSAADATEQPIISQFYTRDQSENDNRGPSLTKIHQEQQKLNRERSLITALCKEMNEFTGNISGRVKKNRKSKPFVTITKETCAFALERYDWDLNEAKSVLERFQKHEEGNDGRNRKSTKNKGRKNDDDDEEDESSSSESSDDSSRRRKKRKRKEQKKRESRKKKEKKKKERRNDDDDNDDDNDDDAKEFAFGADEEARKRELEDERKKIKDEQQKAL